VTINLDPFAGGNAEVFKVQAQDAVFEHAVELATASGHSLDSDEFTTIYRDLASRYDTALEYSHYLMQVSFVALKAMMETGYVSLSATVQEEGPVETAIENALRVSAAALTAALTHIAAGKDGLWVDNSIFENAPAELRTIPFTFHLRRLVGDTDD
jgi:hypothetical protein